MCLCKSITLWMWGSYIDDYNWIYRWIVLVFSTPNFTMLLSLHAHQNAWSLLPGPSGVFPSWLRAFVRASQAASCGLVTTSQAWTSATGQDCSAPLWTGHPVAQRTGFQSQRVVAFHVCPHAELHLQAWWLQSRCLAQAPASPTPESLPLGAQDWGWRPQSHCWLHLLLDLVLPCPSVPRCRKACAAHVPSQEQISPRLERGQDAVCLSWKNIFHKLWWVCLIAINKHTASCNQRIFCNLRGY